MRFSVLTPSFGYARFLADGATSVLADQEGVDLEWVVFDGGSTDGTVELAATWTDPRVRFTSEPDEGQSDALNKAFAASTGDVIGWLNADEFYLPGTLAAVAEVFEAHPEVDVVFGDIVQTDAAASIKSLWAMAPIDDTVLERCGCVIASCGFFVRRSALDGWRWDTQLRVLMDWDLYLHLRRTAGAWAHVARPFTGFRMHEEQVTFGPRQRHTHEHQRLTERYRMNRSRWSLRVGDTYYQLRNLLTGARSRERRATALAGQDLWALAHERGLAPWKDVYGGALGRVTVTGRRRRR